MTPPDGRAHIYDVVTVIVIVVMMLLIYFLLSYSSSAGAHDHKRADLDQWYMSLHSVSGTPCCDGTEAIHIVPDDWSEWRDVLHCVHAEYDQDVGPAQHGQYCVRILGQWWN